MSLAALIAPVIIIAVFALPYVVSIVRHRGFMGLAIIFALAAYTLAVMTLAVQTGLPYGRFVYDSALGYKLFGIVPWVVIVVYPALLLALFWAASKFTHKTSRIAMTTLLGVLASLMLDPILVKLELWQWENPGPFYGVPVLSFVGWFFSSLIGATILHLMWSQEALVPRGVSYSGLSLILFWTGANVGVEQWIPAAIGGVIGGLMLLLAGIERWGPYSQRKTLKAIK